MTRYAGDYFGISLRDDEDQGISKLMSYFPSLRSTFGIQSEGADENTPQQTGGKYAVQPFGGSRDTFGAFRADNSNEEGQSSMNDASAAKKVRSDSFDQKARGFAPKFG